MRVPAPPRTIPRCRPCARVITSRIAFASPCWRVPSTMPSSVQSTRGLMFPGAAAFAFRRHHTTGFVIADKTAVVIRLLLFLLRAGVNGVEIGNRLVGQIGRDHETDAAVGCTAKAIDLAFERGLHLKDCVPQRLPLDKIVRELVE